MGKHTHAHMASDFLGKSNFKKSGVQVLQSKAQKAGMHLKENFMLIFSRVHV